jgi:hypothetical protein
LFADLIIPVDPAILIIENDFRIRRNPLSQVHVGSNNNSNKGNDIPSFPLGKITIIKKREII